MIINTQNSKSYHQATAPQPRYHSMSSRYDLLRHRNKCLSLFYALPFELLALIASYCREPCLETRFGSFVRPGPKCTPLSFMQVSHHWKEAAMKDLDLWTSISGTQYAPCSPNPKLVEAWIHRCTGDRPLDFHLSPSEFVESTDMFTERILHVFLRYTKRWGNICFQLDDNLGRILIDEFYNSAIAQPAQITSLELDVEGCSHQVAEDVLDLIPRFQSLRQLYWAGSTHPTGRKVLGLPNLQILVIAAPSIRHASLLLRLFTISPDQHVVISLPPTKPHVTGDHWDGVLRSALEHLKPKHLTIEDDQVGCEEARRLLCLVHKLGIPELTIKSCSIEDIQNTVTSPLTWLWNSRDIRQWLTIKKGEELHYLRKECSKEV